MALIALSLVLYAIPLGSCQTGAEIVHVASFDATHNEASNKYGSSPYLHEKGFAHYFNLAAGQTMDWFIFADSGQDTSYSVSNVVIHLFYCSTAGLCLYVG